MPTPAPPPLPLRTERLVLRAYRLDDVDATLSYYGDAEVSRYLLSEPFTPDVARETVDKRVLRTHPTAKEEALALVVEHDGQLVGDLVLQLLDDQLWMAEIGWAFNPKYAGRGFATESARALIELGFDHYGLHRIKAQLDGRNTDSARLCERLGMTREAHLRQDYWSKGEWTDTLIYGVLATEWPPR